jgi:hypothetical protein
MTVLITIVTGNAQIGLYAKFDFENKSNLTNVKTVWNLMMKIFIRFLELISEARRFQV